MTKLLLSSVIAYAFLLSGCKKDSETPPPESPKRCWTFTTTIKTSVSGASVPGYPKKTTSKTTKCNLTYDEAKKIADDLSYTATATEGKYKVTVRTTTTFK